MRYKQFWRHFTNALWRPQNDLAVESRLLHSCNSYVCCDLAKKHREVYFIIANFPVSYNATILLCGAVRAACSILLHQEASRETEFGVGRVAESSASLPDLRKRKLHFAADDWRHRPIIPVKVRLVALDWHSYLKGTAVSVKTNCFFLISVR